MIAHLPHIVPQSGLFRRLLCTLPLLIFYEDIVAHHLGCTYTCLQKSKTKNCVKMMNTKERLGMDWAVSSSKCWEGGATEGIDRKSKRIAFSESFALRTRVGTQQVRKRVGPHNRSESRLDWSFFKKGVRITKHARSRKSLQIHTASHDYYHSNNYKIAHSHAPISTVFFRHQSGKLVDKFPILSPRDFMPRHRVDNVPNG